MKKGKSITLLSIIGVIMAFLLVMTFIKFPVGMKNYNGLLGAIETDYDISGGTAYTLTLSEDNTEAIKDEDIDEVIKTLEYRIQELGYNTYSVKALKKAGVSDADYDVRIEAKADTNEYGQPNLTTLASDIAVVAQYGEVEFYGGTSANPTDRIMQDITVVKDAYYSGMTSDGKETYYFSTSIEFTDEAMDFLNEQLDAGSYYLQIKLGDTTLLSGSSALSKSYFVNNAIAVSSQTTSTDEDTLAQMEKNSRQTALQIKSGGLKYKFDVDEGVNVTSPYGENTALYSVIAVSAVAVVCMLVLTLLYKGFGLISALSMIGFMLIEIGMLVAVPGIVVSMGSVLGVAFATILCADGLFMTGKRINEELANNKTVKASFNTGFKRALMPIINASVVSAIVSVVLLIFGKGTLYGFAVAFGIGTIASVIATLVFSRMFSALILPLAKNNEKFFAGKRGE